MKLGTASKFLSFPGIEPRATDHTRLFLYKITSVLLESTGFEASSLLGQRFSNFFQVGTTFISQNVLRTTLLLGLSNLLGLP